MAIPVVDIFAGPGGLGEGFSALLGEENERHFKIALSIEKDAEAHKTLTLRSFFRQFPFGEVPENYYAFIRGEITIDELYRRHPNEHKLASHEAWQAELGKIPNSEVDTRITSALNGEKDWLLIGGPPCQAYSVVGRSRRKEKILDPVKDHRVELYKQYLRILAVHSPTVFIMENVKGMLSAAVKDSPIFHRILNDLSDPIGALKSELEKNKQSVSSIKDLNCPGYRIYSLTKKPSGTDLYGNPIFNQKDFIIRAEDHGVPQCRHRVILVGIRNDINRTPDTIVKVDTVAVSNVLSGLPRLRSGLSKQEDTMENWRNILLNALKNGTIDGADKKVIKEVERNIRQIRTPHKGVGSDFVKYKNVDVHHIPNWYLDEKLKGVANHCSRGHMNSDLYRYLFVSCYGKVHKKSPKLVDFPSKLLPAHQNVEAALTDNKFADRFRVQLKDKPAKTITSHISKDGHYYIHPDPSQCRSLTVREAARIQTFPDNYYFCGSRTAQFSQVGNAVPPFLAYQIAKVVADIFFPADNNCNEVVEQTATKVSCDVISM